MNQNQTTTTEIQPKKVVLVTTQDHTAVVRIILDGQKKKLRDRVLNFGGGYKPIFGNITIEVDPTLETGSDKQYDSYTYGMNAQKWCAAHESGEIEIPSTCYDGTTPDNTIVCIIYPYDGDGIEWVNCVVEWAKRQNFQTVVLTSPQRSSGTDFNPPEGWYKMEFKTFNVCQNLQTNRENLPHYLRDDYDKIGLEIINDYYLWSSFKLDYIHPSLPSMNTINNAISTLRGASLIQPVNSEEVDMWLKNFNTQLSGYMWKWVAGYPSYSHMESVKRVALTAVLFHLGLTIVKCKDPYEYTKFKIYGLEYVAGKYWIQDIAILNEDDSGTALTTWLNNPRFYL